MTPELHKLEHRAETDVSPRTVPEPVRSWNETATPYPRDKTVRELFEEIAREQGDRVAVAFGEQQLTYAELNRRANRLAHRLLRMGVGPETMVGCAVERSLELIVALLAILKAGGAYVPLDPSYPRERLNYFLGEIRTPVVLLQSSLARSLTAWRDVPAIIVDEEPGAQSQDESDPPQLSGPASLAYVMFTSGSTGRPKGVMVENRAIVRLVRNTNYCHFGPDETFLQFAPVSFDASTLEIWGPLLNGGKLVVMPPQAASLEDLGRVIRENQVTTVWLTAGIFHLMVEQRLEDLRPIRQLVAGGDVLSAKHVRLVLENLPECSLINGYGPTENTTFTCCHAMRGGTEIHGSVPIGRPIANTRVYILDDQMRVLGPGETGELFAVGDGVARGYLNNPEETAGRFVPDPFSAEPNGRMYRTGDLARWGNDGVIEFLGRIDNQVKVLGHRIEPGEVETVLRMHEGIAQVCVVSFGEDGSKRLVAYYVESSGRATKPNELRDFLVRKVPNYMMPSLFVPLEALPLSPNGKIDRSGLPLPSFASVKEASDESPKTTLEQAVAGLWQRILRVEHVGLDDNFFDLGGDSLLLVAVHSNLQKEMKIEIPVVDLFEFTTVRTLAAHLNKKQPAGIGFSEIQLQGQKQREALACARERRRGGAA